MSGRRHADEIPVSRRRFVHVHVGHMHVAYCTCSTVKLHVAHACELYNVMYSKGSLLLGILFF